MPAERCETCRFWGVATVVQRGTNDPPGFIGDCRRYPPQLVSEALRRDPQFNPDSLECYWLGTQAPVTSAQGWCGEWQAKDIESRTS